MHVVYALSTDGDRRYADMAALSATSVTRLHPDAKITILTDDESLTQVRAFLGDYPGMAGRVESVGSCVGTARFRSRFVKTQVRAAVAGDFLYLDADTIPVGDFADIFRSAAVLCAAVDRNPEAPSGARFPDWAVPEFERLGWPAPTPIYLNTGVTFWKDTAQTHAFARSWHENWLRFFSIAENPADQPAFNHSLRAAEFVPEILQDRFNARVGLAPEFARGALICHFYADPRAPGGLAHDEVLARFRQGAGIDRSIVEAAIQRSHRR